MRSCGQSLWLGTALLAAAVLTLASAIPAHAQNAPADGATGAAAAGGSAAPAQAQPPEAPLPAGFPAALAQALKAARLPGAAVGLMVQEVATGRVIASLNADRALNPASVMKLVTTYGALELMGPSYHWRTGFFETGVRRGDVLEGDLVIRGSGDPRFTQEALWLALKAVRARGVREIRGNFVLDRSAFDAAGHDPAKFDGDPLRAYNAGSDALLINFKSLALTFVPQEGEVVVAVEPRLAGLPLRNAVRMGSGPCVDFRAYPVKPRVDATGIALSGTYSSACGVRTWWLHPHELTHVQYAGAVLRQLWTEVGGTLAGDVRDGALPVGARLVHEAESVSLAEVVRDINKFSNNVMARQLFLSLPVEVLKLPGSADRAARAYRAWLMEKKLGGEELVMENGSGLSRVERVASGTLSRMLVAAYRSPVMPEFMSSMPLVAYDGTMRRRLKTRDVAGQAHIKTGSLNEVRSIAGYVLAASGRRYAVVCVVNHAAPGAAQGLHDALLQWVYAEG
ncbi:MAG: D-alanyl-D-alanine carboxypeptidase/D-alanyl-D-alanine-endopeptidase [Burkholderiales bacterium]